ncbi:MAG: hypothetical protein ACI9JT_000260 [Polaribacter sp.]|jgi:hypothetical protein
MRLLVFLDEEIEDVKLISGDVLLVNNIRQLEKYKDHFTVEYIDSSLLDENEEFVEEINLFFEQLPQEFMDLRNEIFARFFKPVFSALKKIDNIIEESDVSEIILFGGNRFQFVTLHGGEGESKKYKYRSSWLLNVFIEQYLKDKVRVLWKRTKPFLFLFHFFRELPRFFKLSLKAALNINNKKNQILKKAISKIKDSNVVFVSSIIEFNQIQQLLSSVKQNKTLYLSSNSSLNLKSKDSNVYNYSSISFFSFLKAEFTFRKLLSSVKSKHFFFSFEGKKIQINKSSFLRATKTNFVRNSAHFYELQGLLKSYNKNKESLIITAKTFGDDIVLANKIAKLFNIKHCNFQIVSMAKVLLPQIHLADLFYLYSFKTHQFYTQYSDSYKYYLPLNSDNVRSKKDEKSESQFILTIFTQPDWYTNRYVKVLNEVLPLLETNSQSCVVRIKPHYRERDIHLFKQFSNTYDFVELLDNSLSPKELMNSSDFILSMTSAVLFESLMLDCPALIADFDGLDRKWIYDNDICFPEVNFVVNSGEDLLNILINKKEHQKMYQERRNCWIRDNTGVTVSDIFQ